MDGIKSGGGSAIPIVHRICLSVSNQSMSFNFVKSFEIETGTVLKSGPSSVNEIHYHRERVR